MLSIKNIDTEEIIYFIIVGVIILLILLGKTTPNSAVMVGLLALGINIRRIIKKYM
ncbi:hypothetical protein EV214_13823 [Marinisporobacter balticus]|uniref:Uncharacterized protein n=1 Tax=Marinisporobacter balticus TaxID=2018667 RepID=A0A4V2S9Q9_9FIRM|nr:hypothetical protein EV214_13823 [Marinisporobacter balticus]